MSEKPSISEGTRHEAELDLLRLLENVFDPAWWPCDAVGPIGRFLDDSLDSRKRPRCYDRSTVPR